MKVISGSGRFTPPAGQDPNHWVEHLSVADLSVEPARGDLRDLPPDRDHGVAEPVQPGQVLALSLIHI